LQNIVPDLKPTEGKLFTEDNITQGDSVAVVNVAFAKASEAKINSLVGEKIQVNGIKLTIVGLVGEETDTTPQLYYPFTLLTYDQLKSTPPLVYALAKQTEHIPTLKEEIQNWLNEKFPKSKEDFQVVTNDFRVEQAAKGFLLFRVIMGLIVGISVVVGGVGVMNVLLISVTERTSEIGIRKAVGANPKHIALQFLSESVTISAFGSLLGLIAGVLGTLIVVPIIKSITKMPFQAVYTWNTILVVAIVALLVGITFGTYPAMRASRLNPVDAIRHE
jgi:putative ABC transport system permease protein